MRKESKRSFVHLPDYREIAMNRSNLMLFATLALTGCATYGPTWSEISGDRYTRTTINRAPALIEKVDGYSAYASYPVRGTRPAALGTCRRLRRGHRRLRYRHELTHRSTICA